MLALVRRPHRALGAVLLTVLGGLLAPTAVQATPIDVQAAPAGAAISAQLTATVAVRVAAAAPRVLGVNATRIGTDVRIYGIDTRGAVYQQVLRGTTWTARAALGGGTMRAAPTAIYRAAGRRTDLFAVAADGRLLQKTGGPTRWGSWFSVPVRGFAGPLSSLVSPEGDVHLFGPDAAGRVVHAVYDHRSGWRQSLLTGDVVRGNVSAVYQSAGNRIDLFSVDRQQRISQRTSMNGRWAAWHPVSRTGFTGGVAVIRAGTDGWRVIARGGGGVSYQTVFSSRKWRTPERWGGTSVGHPAATASASGGRFLTVASSGVVSQRTVGSACCRWAALPHPAPPKSTPPPAPKPPTTRVELAQALLARWGGRLTGLGPVRDDLAKTAAGGSIRNPCGQNVYLDAAMLQVIYAASGRYQVFVNNMVSGRGCDSGYHPRGMAVDFNTVVDPATGRSTNWHTGSGSDNQGLDREFLTYAAAQVKTGGGAGQANCAGSATAPLPPQMIRFTDACNHQHLDTRR
ncbi:MAG: hypothetical protein WKF57_03580 [Nakamurella sp.]